jgi:hypothetical protein
MLRRNPAAYEQQNKILATRSILKLIVGFRFTLQNGAVGCVYSPAKTRAVNAKSLFIADTMYEI